jgi:hypothetical protein
MTCPYRDGCPEYNPCSVTCNGDSGGPYCPEWRSRKEIDAIISRAVRRVFPFITALALIIILAFVWWLMEVIRL